MRLPSSGRSISFWYYIDGSLDTMWSDYLGISFWGCNASGCSIASGAVASTTPTLRTWTQSVASISAPSAVDLPETVAFSLFGTLHPSGSNATLYLDDIVMQ